MVYTHRFMILDRLHIKVDEMGVSTIRPNILLEYAEFPLRFNLIAPPGDPQPTYNVPNVLNVHPVYVETDWPTTNLLAADGYLFIQEPELIPARPPV